MIVWNEIRTLLICDKNLVIFVLKMTLSKRTLYLCMMLIEKIPTYAMNAKSCVFFSILDAFFFVSTHGSICISRNGRSTGKVWKWWVPSASARDNTRNLISRKCWFWHVFLLELPQTELSEAGLFIITSHSWNLIHYIW